MEIDGSRISYHIYTRSLLCPRPKEENALTDHFTQPPFHVPQGKYKHSSWKKLVDEGLSPEDAQIKYVELIEKLKEKYGYDEGKEPEQVGGK